jgi:hypothetical protein
MKEAVWHDDGHVIRLEINKDQMIVAETICPQKGTCKHEDTSCVVEYFLDRYGMELNVGVCRAAADIRIAWSLNEDSKDLDACQVWIIPTDDAMFAAWADYQRA